MRQGSPVLVRTMGSIDDAERWLALLWIAIVERGVATPRIDVCGGLRVRFVVRFRDPAEKRAVLAALETAAPLRRRSAALLGS